MLGLLLAGVWQGEIHSHDNGAAAHSHAHDFDAHDFDSSEQDSGSGDSAPEPLHLHDAAVSVVMLGPPMQGTELPKLSATWVPDDSAIRAPPQSFNAPHRPPIA